MVNTNEKQILEQYQQQGWRVVRGGSPDFLMLKVNDDGEILDFLFVECKTVGGKLDYNQAVYRKVLEKLGAKYKIEYVESE